LAAVEVEARARDWDILSRKRLEEAGGMPSSLRRAYDDIAPLA
jgi:hypothetical protein